MNEELKKIYTVLPDEIRNWHPHGQWTLSTPGGLINFACDVTDDNFPLIEPWARRLEEFRHSDADFLEFESPHLPGVCYLHRVALEHIVMTQPAWSAKTIARQRVNGPVQLVDAESGVPLVRRKLD